MKPVLSVRQMREVDRRATGGDIAVGFEYMRRAGRGLLKAVRGLLPDPLSGDIAIVCGKGNNGGDGYMAGSLLLDAGYRVMCFSLVPSEELRGESLKAYREYETRQGNVMVIDDVADFRAEDFKLIIDCLLGTGIHGNPRGIFAAMINAVNDSGVPVISADTPSGLNNDTGEAWNPCIKATITVAMGFAKPGLYFHPGKELVGRLIVEDLDYPQQIVSSVEPTCFTPTIESLRAFMPRRKPAGSKFDHGQVVLVGGSPGMSGSITLAAEAAMRSGCGMLHCVFPEMLSDILSIKLTEPVLHALPATAAGTLDYNSIDEILALVSSRQALCIGPGLSHELSASHLVRELISRCNIPVILDADGINAFKGVVEELEHHAGPLVMTPHKGEWERLFGPLPSAPLERISLLSNTARQLRAVILLKGNPTVAADPEGKSFILPYGNSALAKAGSGDVLSGIIASLIAQGTGITEAAVLGAYLHGTAGEIAAATLTEYSVTARDVIASLPQSIRLLIK